MIIDRLHLLISKGAICVICPFPCHATKSRMARTCWGFQFDTPSKSDRFVPSKLKFSNRYKPQNPSDSISILGGPKNATFLRTHARLALHLTDQSPLHPSPTTGVESENLNTSKNKKQQTDSCSTAKSRISQCISVLCSESDLQTIDVSCVAAIFAAEAAVTILRTHPCDRGPTMWEFLPSLKGTATLDLFSEAAVILQIATSDECHEFHTIFHAVNVCQKYVFRRFTSKMWETSIQKNFKALVSAKLLGSNHGQLGLFVLSDSKSFPLLQPSKRILPRLSVMRPRVNIFFDVTSGTRNTPNWTSSFLVQQRAHTTQEMIRGWAVIIQQFILCDLGVYCDLRVLYIYIYIHMFEMILLKLYVWQSLPMKRTMQLKSNRILQPWWRKGCHQTKPAMVSWWNQRIWWPPWWPKKATPWKSQPRSISQRTWTHASAGASTQGLQSICTKSTRWVE